MQCTIEVNGDGVVYFGSVQLHTLKSKVTLQQRTNSIFFFSFGFNWFQIDLVDSTFMYRVVNLRRIDMYPCLNA